MTTPIIVHHMAALDKNFPPNSLEAIRACLDAQAPFIEVDIVALARDDYLLVHDDVLESETTGSGVVGETATEQVRDLFIKTRSGDPTLYRPAVLRDVVALFRDYSNNSRLQLDFKNVLPMTTPEPLERLIKLIEPLGERVIVSSGADWQLRRLRKLAPWLDVGFDIQFYLDWRAPDRTVDSRIPPFKRGVYGYQDDHLLATQRIWSTAEYLAERCEILMTHVPGASIFYVNQTLLVQALDDGFNMAAALHTHGIRLDTWTVDADKPVTLVNARRLLKAGVDLFTTNTPVELAAALKE